MPQAVTTVGTIVVSGFLTALVVVGTLLVTVFYLIYRDLRSFYEPTPTPTPNPKQPICMYVIVILSLPIPP